MTALRLLFLSSEELRDLTDLKIPKAQMKWLDKNNFPYVVSAAGKPKVLRSFLITRFQESNLATQNNEPNFDAIR